MSSVHWERVDELGVLIDFVAGGGVVCVDGDGEMVPLISGGSGKVG